MAQLVDALAIEECSHEEEQQVCEESVSTIPRWAQHKQTLRLSVAGKVRIGDLMW
jgi:hypothetical protein